MAGSWEWMLPRTQQLRAQKKGRGRRGVGKELILIHGEIMKSPNESRIL